MTEAILSAIGLTHYFGGLAAANEVSIALHTNRLHAVLGPNGAGKSTLINLLAGELAPSAGSIRLRGREISALSADRRSRLGIGRSYQKTNLFSDFTVHENCRLAAQSRAPRAWRVFSSALADRRLHDEAERALAQAGLASRAGALAGALSHGEQRQLEIAMVLATRPEVLLLDEPLAGMGSEESARMIELLRRLSPAHAILLVEHDLDAVFALAETITVMINGHVLESGTPTAIRASPTVQQAYLGQSDSGHG